MFLKEIRVKSRDNRLSRARQSPATEVRRLLHRSGPRDNRTEKGPLNFCIILMILFPLILNFQKALPQSTVKIEGYVINTTGQPLEGANVIVIGTGFGAATDVTGYFAIENLFAGEYTLIASFMGYQNEIRQGVVVQKDYVTTVNFELQPVVLPFEEIVVEADRVIREESDFKEIISMEEIHRSAARSVAEILINIPGVEILDEGGGSGRKRVSIRGSNSNQVLVIQDGVPLNDPLVGDVDLSQISLSSVEKIYIWKGGNSSRFGGGALGGVIEIISKKDPVDEIRFGSHFGVFGAYGFHPALSGHFKRINYFLNFENLNEEGNYPYTYQKLDGTRVQERRLNADFSSRNYFGKIIFENGNQLFQFQVNYYRSHRGLPGLIFSWTPFAKAESERRLLIGKYSVHQKRWESQIQISQLLNVSEFEHNPPSDAPLRYRTIPPYHTKYRVLSHRGAFELKSFLFNKYSFYINAALQKDDFRDEDLLTGSFGPIQATKNLTYSWSIRNEWYLPAPIFISKIVLAPAVRIDVISFKNSEYNRNDHQVSPRVGLFISKRDGWVLNLKANWGRSFRTPTFADLFYQDFRVRGNPDLLPEKSWDFDLGLHFGLPLLGWLEIDGSYYRHNVKDLIIWELGSFATYQPFNTNALLRGWELGSSWSLWHDRIHLDMSHIISNALNKSGKHTTHNKKLTYRPEFTTKLGVRLEYKFITLNYHKRWIGERFVTASNTIRMPSYTVDDLMIQVIHNFKKLKVNLKLSIFNLFNKKFEIVERAPLPGRYWRTGLEFIY